MNVNKIIKFSLGPIGAALLSLITLPLIAWYFSQEDVGKISMLQVALSFSTLVFSLGLDQSYVRDYNESNDKPMLFKLALFPGGVLLSLTLLCLLIPGDLIGEMLFNENSAYISVLVVLAVILSFISRFLLLILRMKEYGGLFSLGQILSKVILFIMVVFFIAFYDVYDFEYLILAHVTAIALTATYLLFVTKDEWIKSYNKPLEIEKITPMLKFGFPLIFGGVAFWGLTALDRIILKEISSYSELAIYSMAVSFAAAATILQSIFSTVWAPTVYKWALKIDGVEKINAVNNYVLLCVVVIFSVVGLFGWLIKLFLPEGYEQVQWILVSSISYPLFYTLSESTSVGIGITKKTIYSMFTAVIALIVNLAGNFILVPKYGASGASAATAISFFTYFILRTEFSILVWEVIPRARLYVYSFLLMIGAIFSALFGEAFSEIVYIYWLLILSTTFFFFRNEFFSALTLARSIKNKA